MHDRFMGKVLHSGCQG